MASASNFGHARLTDFSLARGTIHANHGSYGAVPNVVAEAQTRLRNEIEANPSRFFRTRYAELMRRAASEVAGLLGGATEDWVFVDNATAGVNTVAAAVGLRAGDEVLTTDQVYGAVRKALLHHTARADAILVEARIRVPVGDETDIVDALEACITQRTKLAVIDHVTSQSGIVFPVDRLAAMFGEKGIPILVDGAHAPGMIDVDVPSLAVDWYTGNGHKWLGTPRGCGFLWCRRDRQTTLHPLVISHGYGRGYTAEFDWVGTRDPSPWLSVSAAIDYHRRNGGASLRKRNRELALAAGTRIAAALDTELAAPAGLLASMVAIRLPSLHAFSPDDTEALQIELERRANVEASLTALEGRPWVRLSAAAYNELDDLLAAAHAAANLFGSQQ